MKRHELIFERPAELVANTPYEADGFARDEIRLLVSTSNGHRHTQFMNLANHLSPGDLLVVNESATLPASLPAIGPFGQFTLNLSTDYGQGLWVAEPRWSPDKPGPLPLEIGTYIDLAGMRARFIMQFPGITRLWFIQLDKGLDQVFRCCGKPIRYHYVDRVYPLATYQTIFSRVPGSAEMPSAGRPFSRRVLSALEVKGIQVAPIVLHTGVSSLEVETELVHEHTLYPEPFHVPRDTAVAVNTAQEDGRRVIAVGTTVVRALESAWVGEKVRPMSGFTRLFIHPGRGVNVIDGLITGLHDPVSSHLAMLYTIAGKDMILNAYQEAIERRYLWHEFGDSHLILPGK